MKYGCEVTRITKHKVAPEDNGTKTFQWRAKIIEVPSKKAKRGKKAKKSPARKAA